LAGLPRVGLLTENISDFTQPSLPNAGILHYCTKTPCF
jgi:hypothetical protein